MAVRALVTGANGFLGSHLTELLVEQGESVAILCRPHSNLWRLEPLLDRVTVMESTLLSLAEVEERIGQFAPDTIFHLAWFGVTPQFRNDFRQIEENLPGTLNLLKISQKAGARTWVGLGSQAEYGPHSGRITEEAHTSPTTLYGTVKLCTFYLLRHLIQEPMRFVWLRVFSTFGPKENPDWLLPYLIRTLLRREKPALTLGEQMWDYLYAKDAAWAIYLAAHNPRAQGVYNLGSGQAVKLRSIVEQIRDLIDPGLPLGFGEIPYRPDQVMHLEADISRLVRDTGWTPQVGLAEGLRLTVAWFRDYEGIHV